MDTNYSGDSDSSDEDYIPGGTNTEGIPSEIDSDGDLEDPLSDSEVLSTKRKMTHRKSKKRSKRINEVHRTEINKDAIPANAEMKQELSRDEKKKHADDLWASFKKDTGFKRKEVNSQAETETSESNESKINSTKDSQPLKPTKTIKITQVYEFAGEAVQVEKEVKADSVEALGAKQSSQSSISNVTTKRKTGLAGIGSVLSQIGKKQKLSTLEKSKLDWNQFKQRENIADELESYKKGKDGYLDKQDFLQRADLRQFEIERDIRAVERSKRLNNTS